MLISRRAGWLAVAALWLAFGLLTGLEVWLSMLAHNHSVPRLLTYYVAVWEVWLGFTAVILWVIRRWPIIPLTVRGVVVHVSAACLIGFVHTVYWTMLLLLIKPFDRMTATWAQIDPMEQIFSRLPEELLLYVTVVAAVQAADYYGKYRERALETERLESSLTSARLHALELQLQPHFLFNTLNAISSLVRTRQNDEAVVMIAGLSDLLRYSLDHAGNQRVTLEQESGMLRRYLEIQRARFPDRLSFQIDITSEARRVAVPTLILQPLAENAIRHGIARSAGAGFVNVRAFREDGHLRIDLFNTGLLGANGEGIGLRNTRERLRQFYGDGHRFELQNADGGVLASLTIPWLEAA